MLNPIFWKKIQGEKHAGRWGIVKHQIPSNKVLFKTNTKSHKHPGIKLLSESKTQLVSQRNQNSYKRAYIYIWYVYIYVYIYIFTYLLTQSFRTGTKVVRSKYIIQPTSFDACYSTCCQWDGEDMPAPWERTNSHPPVRVKRSCKHRSGGILIIDIIESHYVVICVFLIPYVSDQIEEVITRDAKPF